MLGSFELGSCSFEKRESRLSSSKQRNRGKMVFFLISSFSSTCWSTTGLESAVSCSSCWWVIFL